MLECIRWRIIPASYHWCLLEIPSSPISAKGGVEIRFLILFAISNGTESLTSTQTSTSPPELGHTFHTSTSQKCPTLTTTLIPMTIMMCEQPHDHQHDHDDDTTPALQNLLYEQIDFSAVICLNETEPRLGAKVLQKTWMERMAPEPELKSDADEQLLLTVPYERPKEPCCW